MRCLALSFALVAFMSTDASPEAQEMKILVSSRRADLVEELKKASPLARIVPVTPETVMREISDADAFIGRITPEQVRAGKKLKWVGSMSAGVERVLHLSGGPDLRDSDIVLTNNQIVQGPEIADHAMGMLLTLARDIDRFLEDKRSRRWQRRPYAGIELNGRTALIVGVAAQAVGPPLIASARVHTVGVTGHRKAGVAGVDVAAGADVVAGGSLGVVEGLVAREGGEQQLDDGGSQGTAEHDGPQPRGALQRSHQQGAHDGTDTGSGDQHAIAARVLTEAAGE